MSATESRPTIVPTGKFALFIDSFRIRTVHWLFSVALLGITISWSNTSAGSGLVADSSAIRISLGSGWSSMMVQVALRLPPGGIVRDPGPSHFTWPTPSSSSGAEGGMLASVVEHEP